jgi:hypothetical protein
MESLINVDTKEIKNKHETKIKKKSPIKELQNKKNELLITSTLVKIYDIIEYKENTYYCHKNKIYNKDKKLCGLIIDDETRMFDEDMNNINNKIKNLNNEYLHSINKK